MFEYEMCMWKRFGERMNNEQLTEWKRQKVGSRLKEIIASEVTNYAENLYSIWKYRKKIASECCAIFLQMTLTFSLKLQYAVWQKNETRH